METTHDTYDDPWAWPCPYCGSHNAIEAAECGACRAQLRDPEEDDLFTTIATENAQIVDPSAPRVREALWSTEVTPPEDVAEEVAAPPDGSIAGMKPATERPPVDGPFSHNLSNASVGPRADQSPGAHGSGGGTQPTSFAASAASPFGPSRGEPPMDRQPRSQPGPAVAAQDPFSMAQGSAAGAGQVQPVASEDPAQVGATHVTPDENGLSVAVDHLRAADRERCAVPIGVCGALLGEQEVVLGMLAGHLMGHASVLMVTNNRVLVANSRRWKPLLDQYLPSRDLVVHLRHDRDVASLTLVQGQRLTTLDGISDVAGAMELTERIRALAAAQ